MKTSDLIKHCGSMEKVGKLFTPSISRAAVCQWGNRIPPLRVYQLKDHHPELVEQLTKKSGK